MTAQKSTTLKSIIDWAAYAILGAGLAAVINGQARALDLAQAHAILLAKISTWAAIVGEKIGTHFN